ncbi:hypothetical protein OROMI_015016 [Orobanche minor]
MSHLFLMNRNCRLGPGTGSLRSGGNTREGRQVDSDWWLQSDLGRWVGWNMDMLSGTVESVKTIDRLGWKTIGSFSPTRGASCQFSAAKDRQTTQVVDRPTQGHKFLSREYVQPRWVFDCVNARIILPTEKYMVGCVPPPHLSPFIDNEAEGHIPDYAEAIERLKNAERKDVLPFPGMGKEDLEDPRSLLGINDRKEAIEAAERIQKV